VPVEEEEEEEVILIYLFIYFCYISHDVMIFILYDNQDYAAINLANLTVCLTRSVIGAAKLVH
jgi:hypothetical protein